MDAGWRGGKRELCRHTLGTELEGETDSAPLSVYMAITGMYNSHSEVCLRIHILVYCQCSA